MTAGVATIYNNFMEYRCTIPVGIDANTLTIALRNGAIVLPDGNNGSAGAPTGVKGGYVFPTFVIAAGTREIVAQFNVAQVTVPAGQTYPADAISAVLTGSMPRIIAWNNTGAANFLTTWLPTSFTISGTLAYV